MNVTESELEPVTETAVVKYDMAMFVPSFSEEIRHRGRTFSMDVFAERGKIVVAANLKGDPGTGVETSIEIKSISGFIRSHIRLLAENAVKDLADHYTLSLGPLTDT